MRLRWSRGSVLLEPGQSRRIFKGEKILSTPSFGGEAPCRRFAACKRSLKVVISAKLPDNILAHSSYFSHVVSDVEAPGVEKWERLKKRGKAMASYP